VSAGGGSTQGTRGGTPRAPRESHGLDRISLRLDHLQPATARYLACFASVLARVAHADEHVAELEHGEMCRRVAALAELAPERAAAVVDVAVDLARTHSVEDRRQVTREFREISTPLQRTELFFCLYAIAAADGVISDAETGEIGAIADELGVARTQASGIRADRRFVSPGG
jgi:uncharacterized tellurite resistance protein B-like protein